MINVRLLAAAVLVGAVATRSLGQDAQDAARQAALADFGRGVQAYSDLHHLAALTVPGLRVTTDVGEIHHASDALAAAIRTARPGARQGDIFPPAIAAVVRAAVGSGCQDDYAELLALVTEELEGPLPAPAIHARWPMGAPLPTMPPDLLAALPRLPQGLEYRFVNRDLVLLDIDANLIVDFVPNAIPSSTSPL